MEIAFFENAHRTFVFFSGKNFNIYYLLCPVLHLPTVTFTLSLPYLLGSAQYSRCSVKGGQTVTYFSQLQAWFCIPTKTKIKLTNFHIRFEILILSSIWNNALVTIFQCYYQCVPTTAIKRSFDTVIYNVIYQLCGVLMYFTFGSIADLIDWMGSVATF